MERPSQTLLPSKFSAEQALALPPRPSAFTEDQQQQQQEGSGSGQGLLPARQSGSMAAAARSARATPPPWNLDTQLSGAPSSGRSYAKTLSAVEEQAEEGPPPPPKGAGKAPDEARGADAK